MRIAAILASAATAFLFSFAPASAEKRVALVIGNAAYLHAGELKNPRNDANDFAAALGRLGFSLVGGRAQLDLDKPGMDRAARDFAEALVGADVGVFFYSGHGLQVSGINYLVPVDARLTSAAALDFEMLRFDLVQRSMERETKTNLLFLDACRDNPLARNLARAMGTRSADIGRGFAVVESGVGTLISFATQPNNVALDGEGHNSPYTTALLKFIESNAEDLSGILISVRNDVRAATANRQVPWENSALTGRFYFRTPAVPQPPKPATLSLDPFALMWLTTKDTTSIAVLEQFIEYAKQYDNSPPYIRMARARIDELKKQAAASPPTQPPAAPIQVQPPAPPLFGAHPLTAAQERALKPKDVFKECDKCPEMVVIAAGSFTMGSPGDEEGRLYGEKGRLDFEDPRHRISIPRPFAVGRFAITFDEWDACVIDGGCNGYRPGDEGWGRGRMPAINVSWGDAKVYVAWLSRKTGKSYRLLTESEREYVTRAGTVTPFWWGRSASVDQANYDGTQTYAAGTVGENRQRTVPVDSFSPNPWGLYQVHGNVWEWLEDCWNASYKGAPSDGSAWLTGDCTNRNQRGGSWAYAPRYMRSARRNTVPADFRGNIQGFRVARSIDK
jgi:formylglycine-generating enzyme required for sulfatase activity